MLARILAIRFVKATLAAASVSFGVDIDVLDHRRL